MILIQGILVTFYRICLCELRTVLQELLWDIVPSLIVAKT